MFALQKQLWGAAALHHANAAGTGELELEITVHDVMTKKRRNS